MTSILDPAPMGLVFLVSRVFSENLDKALTISDSESMGRSILLKTKRKVHTCHVKPNIAQENMPFLKRFHCFRA